MTTNVRDRWREIAEDERPLYRRPVLTGVAVLLLLAVGLQFCAVRSGDSHNAYQDVAIDDCFLNGAGNFEASGRIVNRGSGTKDYTIAVRFDGSSAQLGASEVTVRDVASGASRVFRTQLTTSITGPLRECTITSVERR